MLDTSFEVAGEPRDVPTYVLDGRLRHIPIDLPIGTRFSMWKPDYGFVDDTADGHPISFESWHFSGRGYGLIQGVNALLDNYHQEAQELQAHFKRVHKVAPKYAIMRVDSAVWAGEVTRDGNNSYGISVALMFLSQDPWYSLWVSPPPIGDWRITPAFYYALVRGEQAHHLWRAHHEAMEG